MTEPHTIVNLIEGGDSLTGCSRDEFFHWIGQASKGDCSDPLFQVQAVYLSDTVAGVAGVRVLGLNMGVAGSRLETPVDDNFVAVRETYIDPIMTVRSFPGGAHRISILICGIGSNDGAIGIYGDGNFVQYAEAVAAACVAGKTLGHIDYVMMKTLLPRGDGVMTEPNRLGFNSTLMNASWRAANGVDGVVNWAGQAIMGDPASLTNPIYYDLDLVHYTDAGGVLLVPIKQAALVTMLPAYFQ